MKYTDSRFRSAPPRRCSPVEEATRRSQPWPGPLPDEFWAKYGKQRRKVENLRLDREKAEASRDYGLAQIDEQVLFERSRTNQAARAAYIRFMDMVYDCPPAAWLSSLATRPPSLCESVISPRATCPRMIRGWAGGRTRTWTLATRVGCGLS